MHRMVFDESAGKFLCDDLRSEKSLPPIFAVLDRERGEEGNCLEEIGVFMSGLLVGLWVREKGCAKPSSRGLRKDTSLRWRKCKEVNGSVGEILYFLTAVTTMVVMG